MLLLLDDVDAAAATVAHSLVGFLNPLRGAASAAAAAPAPASKRAAAKR